MYSWLSEQLRSKFEEVRLSKESPRGSVRLIRHNASGKLFILRRFQGNGEVYRRLLGCSCPHLPLIYEAAEREGENLVIEEFIQGDTLDFLLAESRVIQRCIQINQDKRYEDIMYLTEALL